MQRFWIQESTSLVLQKGDITQIEVDAVVNAANPILLGGGGVDGAIHRAAGPKLREACSKLPNQNGVRCPVGEARITSAFRLPAQWVIHTVGPRYDFVENPEELLSAAYRSSLQLANQHQVKRIAFPAISCGVFGYPLDEAADISIEAVQEAHGNLEQIVFVLFDEAALEAYKDAAYAVLG